MASASRWRRFAFFDRCTLSLPDDVWDDLVPTFNSSGTSGNSTSTFRNGKHDNGEEVPKEAGGGYDDDDDYYESEEEEGATNDMTNNDTTAMSTGTKARHRVIFTCASVSYHPSLLPACACPPSTSTSTSTTGGTPEQPQPFLPAALLRQCAPTTFPNTTSITTTTSARHPTSSTSTVTLCTSACGTFNKNTTVISTNASSTTVAATPPTLSPINGSLAFVYCFPSADNQPISPVLEKVAQHFFASCVQQHNHYPEESFSPPPPHPPSLPQQQLQQQQQQQQISLWNAAANRLGVGTLVLAFLSSRDTSLIHLVDLSMRCNPPTFTAASAIHTTSTATTTNALADQLSAVSIEELEDLDGWRGCINPFLPHVKKIACIASYSSSNHKSNQIHTFDPLQQPSLTTLTSLSTKQRQDLGHLYLAVVSNDTSNKTTTVKVDATTAHNQYGNICVLVDPHLYLQPNLTTTADASTTTNMHPYFPKVYRSNSASTTSSNNSTSPPSYYTCVDIVPPLLAVGTSNGTTLLYSFIPLEQQPEQQQQQRYELVLCMEIPSPTDGSELVEVKSVTLSHDYQRTEEQNSKAPPYPTHIFVCYRRHRMSSKKHTSNFNRGSRGGGALRTSSVSNIVASGVCCYDISFNETQPRSRIDLDSREIPNKRITDCNRDMGLFQVCWSDGLYTYSPSSKVGIVQPIDGRKIAFCRIPSSDTICATSTSSISSATRRHDKDESPIGQPQQTSKGEYILLATSDNKSGRDAIDIYDSTNKLCAFHVLLSPNHRAIQVGGVTTPCSDFGDGGGRRGRSSAIVITVSSFSYLFCYVYFLFSFISYSLLAYCRHSYPIFSLF
jgi:hypothetical protein